MSACLPGSVLIEGLRRKVGGVFAGEPQRSGPITAVPLLETAGRRTTSPGAMPLSQALRTGLVVASECVRAAVGRLLLENQSGDRWVMGLLGETLLGGKQDRALDASILVPPSARVEVPVNCVEQPRWSCVDAFESCTRISSLSVRTVISRESGTRLEHRQRRVWRAVAHTTADLGAKRGVLRDALRVADQVVGPLADAIHVQPDQVGLSLFHGDRLVALELFNEREQLAHYHPDLVRSVLIDVVRLVSHDLDSGSADAGLAQKTSEVLDAIVNAVWEQRSSVGGGQQLCTRVGGQSVRALIGTTGLEYLGAHAGPPAVTLAQGLGDGPFELRFECDAAPMGQVNVGQGKVVVGRSGSCCVQVPEETVSRRHLQIDFSNAKTAVFTDLGSSNGLWMEGERVLFAEVPQGTPVLLGKHVSVSWRLARSQDGDR